MKKIQIYSDWWARPNPGPGGYWVILKFWDKQKELSGFEENTTNNRMELTWVIKWLEALKEPCEIDLYSDSEYVLKGISEWLPNWIKKNFKNVKNIDLWKEYINVSKGHKVHVNWVKGHSGHKENEICDKIAKEEALKRKII